MSPTKKTLIVIVFGSKRRFIVGFGGMAVMVVTTVCGAMIGFNLYRYEPGQYRGLFEGFFGGVIGAVVGVPIWVWLGYKVCREKNAAPNGVIPDDSTT